MANDTEIKQLGTLIESTKSMSNALLKIYPSACLALKYMADDQNILLADLKGRTAANETAKTQGRVYEGAFDLESERAKLKAAGRVI